MMTSKMVENRSLQKASTTQKSLQPYGGGGEKTGVRGTFIQLGQRSPLTR